MAEYIEREAALNFEVDSVLLAPGALQPFMDGMAFYADHIKHIPAADVVPVVRCGECEYHKEARVNKKGFLICPVSGMEITDNDYCSYGARMGEGGE